MNARVMLIGCRPRLTRAARHRINEYRRDLAGITGKTYRLKHCLRKMHGRIVYAVELRASDRTDMTIALIRGVDYEIHPPPAPQ